MQEVIILCNLGNFKMFNLLVEPVYVEATDTNGIFLLLRTSPIAVTSTTPARHMTHIFTWQTLGIH